MIFVLWFIELWIQFPFYKIAYFFPNYLFCNLIFWMLKHVSLDLYSCLLSKLVTVPVVKAIRILWSFAMVIVNYISFPNFSSGHSVCTLSWDVSMEYIYTSPPVASNFHFVVSWWSILKRMSGTLFTWPRGQSLAFFCGTKCSSGFCMNHAAC